MLRRSVELTTHCSLSVESLGTLSAVVHCRTGGDINRSSIVERSYGSFQRTLALPDDVIGDEIKANLDKGVLQLEIPRRETAKQEVRRISINT